MKWLSLLVGSLLFCSCEHKYPVSFHMETTAGLGDKFSLPYQGRFFDRAPFVSQKDFASYYSFPAGDGTYGIVLIAKSGMRHRIEAYTSENIGRYILPVANGHRLSVTQLNQRPIQNGKMAIWGGFSPADLLELSKAIPPHDAKREEPILAMAPHSKKLLVSGEEAAKKEEAKKNQKVISES